MKPAFCFLLFSFLFLSPSFAAAADSQTITILEISGHVKAFSQNKETRLTLQSKLDTSYTLHTTSHAALQLRLPDQTTLTLSENTTIALSKFNATKPQVVALEEGSLRAKINKDYLHYTEGNDKIKFLLKTGTAIMGVRGTDFQAIYNKKTQISSIITYEGEVIMAKTSPSFQLHQAFQLLKSPSARVITQGLFSTLLPQQKTATLPTKLSPLQFNALQKQNPFLPAEKSQANPPSVIPPGVDPTHFTSSPPATSPAVDATNTPSSLPSSFASTPTKTNIAPAGSIDPVTKEITPAAGGFVNLTTGTYTAPSANSTFDEKTQTYTPSTNVGTLDPQTGVFTPNPSAPSSTPLTFTPPTIDTASPVISPTPVTPIIPSIPMVIPAPLTTNATPKTTPGNTGASSGNAAVTSGSTGINSGNTAVTSGGTGASSGNAAVTSGSTGASSGNATGIQIIPKGHIPTTNGLVLPPLQNNASQKN